MSIYLSVSPYFYIQGKVSLKQAKANAARKASMAILAAEGPNPNSPEDGPTTKVAEYALPDYTSHFSMHNGY